MAYLGKFRDRYGGSKLERGRDLFEQCLSSLDLTALKEAIENSKQQQGKRVKEQYKQMTGYVTLPHLNSNHLNSPRLIYIISFAKTIYLLYAKYEEDYGLIRRAFKVYDRACLAVANPDKLVKYSYPLPLPLPLRLPFPFPLHNLGTIYTLLIESGDAHGPACLPRRVREGSQRGGERRG